jgi:Secretion system C-terminal sorting domain
MKKIQFFVMALLCLLLNTTARAQHDSIIVNIDAKYPYQQGFDKIFANITKQYINTGIWYDRVQPLAYLQYYNDSIATNKEYFVQAYYELYNASLDNSKIRNIAQVSNWIAFYRQEDIIPIGIISANYNLFADTIVGDSMIAYKNGLFYDGPKIAKAFKQKTFTYAALLCDKLESGKAYNVKFTDLIFENNYNTVASVTIHLAYPNGDVDDVQLQKNESKAISFAQAGSFNISIELTYANGSTQEFNQNLVIEKGAEKRVSAYTNPLCDPQFYNFNGNNGILTASLPFDGIQGVADTRVYFRIANTIPNNPGASTCATTIARPLIMLDGIDDKGARNHVGIYEGFLKYFDAAINDTIQIGDSIRRLGFDIIIFNPILHEFPLGSGTMIDGGDDFIERNALTLIQLIKNVNADLDAQAAISGLPREEIIVAGPSMGGQVSRLALAFMEWQFLQTGDPVWQHHCRLWASLDSPHLGSSIPIGLQELIKMLSFTGGAAKDKYENNLKSPAARQLLINQSDETSNSIDAVNLNDSGPERVDYINLLNTLGYPQDCRRIAVSNGSSKGGWFHNPGSSMFNIKLGSTSSDNVQIDTKFLPILNSTYSPLSVSCEFETSKFNIVSSLINGTFVVTPVFFHKSLFSSSVINTSVYSGIEACAGSLYDVQAETQEGIINGIAAISASVPQIINNANIASAITSWISGVVSFPVVTHDMAFIPTVSSLGLFNHNFDWSLPIPDDLVCANLTPFHSYYVPAENQKHVSFTQASWRWLRKELLNGRLTGPDCIDVCNLNNGLKGPIVICDGGTYTFTIDNGSILPIGTEVQWILSNGQTSNVIETNFVTSTSNPSVTFTVAYNQNNYVHTPFVKCRIINSCGSDYKEISVNPFIEPLAVNETLLVFRCNQSGQVSLLAPFRPNTFYIWSYDDGGSIQYITNSTGLCPFPLGGNYIITLQMVNTCFSATAAVTDHDEPYCEKEHSQDHDDDQWGDDTQDDGHDQDGPGDQHDDQNDDWGGPRLANTANTNTVTIAVSPNPSHDNWNVLLNGKVNSEVAYSITDITGKLVLSGSQKLARTKKFVIDNQNLSMGTYILSINTNGTMHKIKLVKN